VSLDISCRNAKLLNEVPFALLPLPFTCHKALSWDWHITESRVHRGR
jgi:hypothetical protein